MDLRQLHYFLAVADAGAFNAAAVVLGIAQPSLSVSIRKLEQELGEVLLVRGAKGVALTPTGRMFSTYARSILREADKAVDEVRLLKGVKRGKVTLGLTSVFSTFLGPQALAGFHRAYPDVDVVVDVSTHSFAAIVEAIESGAWDFGFVLLRRGRDHPPAITVEDLVSFDSHVYAASGHPLARRKGVALADLAAYDWVVSSMTSSAAFLNRVFDDASLTRPQVRVVSNSFTLIKELVAEEPFLCMLPDSFAARDVATGAMARIDQAHIQVTSTAGLMWSSRTQLTPAAQRLMARFRAVLAEDLSKRPGTRAEFRPPSPSRRPESRASSPAGRAPGRSATTARRGANTATGRPRD